MEKTWQGSLLVSDRIGKCWRLPAENHKAPCCGAKQPIEQEALLFTAKSQTQDTGIMVASCCHPQACCACRIDSPNTHMSPLINMLPYVQESRRSRSGDSSLPPCPQETWSRSPHLLQTTCDDTGWKTMGVDHYTRNARQCADCSKDAGVLVKGPACSPLSVLPSVSVCIHREYSPRAFLLHRQPRPSAVTDAQFWQRPSLNVLYTQQ